MQYNCRKEIQLNENFRMYAVFWFTVHLERVCGTFSVNKRNNRGLWCCFSHWWTCWRPGSHWQSQKYATSWASWSMDASTSTADTWCIATSSLATCSSVTLCKWRSQTSASRRRLNIEERRRCKLILTNESYWQCLCRCLSGLSWRPVDMIITFMLLNQYTHKELYLNVTFDIVRLFLSCQVYMSWSITLVRMMMLVMCHFWQCVDYLFSYLFS